MRQESEIFQEVSRMISLGKKNNGKSHESQQQGMEAIGANIEQSEGS